MPGTPITSDRLATPVGPFSPAVREGDRVYTSGQVAQDPVTGKLIAGGVAAQTEQILHNLAVILSAADKSLGHVEKVNVYLTDIRDFTEMNDVYAKHFAPPYPARTTVAVAALPLGAKSKSKRSPDDDPARHRLGRAPCNRGTNRLCGITRGAPS